MITLPAAIRCIALATSDASRRGANRSSSPASGVTANPFSGSDTSYRTATPVSTINRIGAPLRIRDWPIDRDSGAAPKDCASQYLAAAHDAGHFAVVNGPIARLRQYVDYQTAVIARSPVIDRVQGMDFCAFVEPARGERVVQLVLGGRRGLSSRVVGRHVPGVGR